MRRPLLLLALAVVAGCANEPSTPGGDPPAELPLVVETDDGAAFRGSALVVAVLDGPDGFVHLTLDAADADGEPGWSANGAAAIEDLEDGELTFELRQLPLTDGRATAARHYGEGDFVGAESGSLNVSLGTDHRADGAAVATPSEVSATFLGPYHLECWVAPEALGQAPNGSGDGSGAVRVQDENFETDFCRRFAAWR